MKAQCFVELLARCYRVNTKDLAADVGWESVPLVSIHPLVLSISASSLVSTLLTTHRLFALYIIPY